MVRPKEAQRSSTEGQGRAASIPLDPEIQEFDPPLPRCDPDVGGEAFRLNTEKTGLSILTEEDFPAWDALVEASGQTSIFCKSWWLKAACDRALVMGFFSSGQMLAGIPLYYCRYMGLRMCRMPPLTQTLGVVMAPLAGKRTTVETRETEILEAFAQRLSAEPIFIQAFHPGVPNWLPFYWHGFTQTTHYTYVLDDLGSINSIWKGLAPDRRGNIRKALRLGLVVKECGPEAVFLAAKKTFEHQGKKIAYSLEYLCRLYDAARSMNAGACFAAQDSAGQVHAAGFFVWDRERGYLLAGGHDPSLGSSGGATLLVWSLIEFAATRTAVFDFEGSMRRAVETSFRSFGASRIAYNRIVKMPRWLRVCLSAAGKIQV